MNPTLTIRITDSALIEMEPAFDDVRAYVRRSDESRDETWEALAPVVEAVENGKPVKGGVIVTLTGEGPIRALRAEAKYRAGHLRDRTYDAWDKSERMSLLGIARGFDSIVKKCDAVVPPAPPAPRVATPAPVVEKAPVELPPEPAEGPFVRFYAPVFIALIKRGGELTPVIKDPAGIERRSHPTFESALAAAEAAWAELLD